MNERAIVPLLGSLSQACGEMIRECTGDDMTVLVLAWPRGSIIETVAISGNRAFDDIAALRAIVDRTLEAAENDSAAFRLANTPAQGRA